MSFINNVKKEEIFENFIWYNIERIKNIIKRS